jgi:hypothetical protein
MKRREFKTPAFFIPRLFSDCESQKYKLQILDSQLSWFAILNIKFIRFAIKVARLAGLSA